MDTLKATNKKCGNCNLDIMYITIENNNMKCIVNNCNRTINNNEKLCNKHKCYNFNCNNFNCIQHMKNNINQDLCYDCNKELFNSKNYSRYSDDEDDFTKFEKFKQANKY